jgi:hypothetical protein
MKYSRVLNLQVVVSVQKSCGYGPLLATIHMDATYPTEAWQTVESYGYPVISCI